MSALLAVGEAAKAYGAKWLMFSIVPSDRTSP